MLLTAGQTMGNYSPEKGGDLPFLGTMINEPMLVYLLALKAVQASGQTQANSSPEKEETFEFQVHWAMK
jgi:hypothetical protein